MPEDLKKSDLRDLSDHGLNPKGGIYWNLSPARLYEESFARGDGQLVHMGGIATVTAPHTGRSPNEDRKSVV